jgi:hypothetical protein
MRKYFNRSDFANIRNFDLELGGNNLFEVSLGSERGY